VHLCFQWDTENCRELEFSVDGQIDLPRRGGVYSALALMRRLLILILAAIPLLARDPVVVVSAPAVPVVKEFDPAHPPIKLDRGAAARTYFTVHVSARYGFEFEATKLTITGVPVEIAATTIIYLPRNAAQELKDHENGHAELYASAYTRDAQREGTAAFTGLIGMTFLGQGANSEEQQADARKQASAELSKRLEQAEDNIFQSGVKLNEKYDELTEHGTSRTVSSAQGKILARKAFVPPGRFRPPRVAMIAAFVCGGLLLWYGVWSFARR
jgi:hypothetical protein